MEVSHRPVAKNETVLDTLGCEIAPSTSASSANNSSTLLLFVEQINPLPKKSFQIVTKKRKSSKPTL